MIYLYEFFVILIWQVVQHLVNPRWVIVFFFFGESSLISWRIKRQNISLFSAEAEYRDMTSVCYKLSWATLIVEGFMNIISKTDIIVLKQPYIASIPFSMRESDT